MNQGIGKTHPAWCDPAACTTTEEGDVEHRSTPVHLQFRGASVSIWLQACDEATRPAQSWEPEATFHIDPTMTSTDGTGLLYLSPIEMGRLNAAITTECERVRLMGFALQWEAAAVAGQVTA